VVDGDQLMATIAASWARQGRLAGGGLVATVMSNLGLERIWRRRGCGLVRTKVGDRYVLEKMRRGYQCRRRTVGAHHPVGLCDDRRRAGRGAAGAGRVKRAGAPASEVLHRFEPLPQLLKNVRFAGGKPLEAKSVKAVIAAAKPSSKGRGRLVIRPSGTEPVIRVMAEGDDAGQVDASSTGSATRCAR
jgi:phosphoglucosamine mutase